MSEVLSHILSLVGIGLIGFLIAMMLAPLEALGWWAGWLGDDLDTSMQEDTTLSSASNLKHKRQYVVFLDGIAKVGVDNYEYAENFLELLETNLPEAIVLGGDIMPYSVTNKGLLKGRPLSTFWRYALQRKLKKTSDAIGFTINFRNLFQVLVSADKRYGPIYNQGEAQVILDNLLRHGYQLKSGTPIILIGYSGGGQIAVGVAPYLKEVLGAPITVISLGGTISSDSGLLQLQHLYHLVGSKDNVHKLGPMLCPGRWPVFAYSTWNQLKQQGKITLMSTGSMVHNGPGSYMDAKQQTADGQSFVEHTVELITNLIRKVKYRIES